MEPTNHNIYSIGHRKGRMATLPPGTSSVSSSQSMWSEAHQRLRRQTLWFSATVVAAALVLVALVTRYYVSVMRTRFIEPRSVMPRREQGLSPLVFEASPETLFLSEELAKPPAGADTGDLPLTVASVKQVAYYLVTAEKAHLQERFTDALDAYQQALRLFPDLRGVQTQIGMISLRLKKYDEGAAAFELAAKEEPLTYSMANNLGVAYLGAENYEKAEEYFRMANRLSPDYAMAYFNMATLFLRRGNLDKAASYFEEYMKRKPSDLKAAQTHALIMIQLQQWESAAALLQKISRDAPDVAPIQFRLAQSLSHTPDRMGAIQALRRAVTLVDPRQALVWLARPEFDLLRNDPDFIQLSEDLGSKE